MASKTSHVEKRDGHRNLGAPRPAELQPPPRAKPSGDPDYFSGSGDPTGTKGNFPPSAAARVDVIGRSADCGKAGFEALPGGRPSPRQQLQRGAQIAGKTDRVQSGDKLESGVPAPID